MEAPFAFKVTVYLGLTVKVSGFEKQCSLDQGLAFLFSAATGFGNSEGPEA